MPEFRFPTSDLTVILPQFQNAHLTRDAVNSLRANRRQPYPILIVDDGSPREQQELLRSLQSPQTRILCQPHRGTTAAWECAARHAQTPLLVFLNNDTVTKGPWIEDLTATLADPHVVAAGIRFREERALPRTLLQDLPTQQFLEGWCFAVRREDLLRIGGFDLALRLYFSDTDLQLRLLAERPDARLVAVTRLPLEHLGHRTTRSPAVAAARPALWKADRDRFIEKWNKVGTRNSEFRNTEQCRAE